MHNNVQKQTALLLAGILLPFCAATSHASSHYTSVKESDCSPPPKQILKAYDAEALGVQQCEGVKGWTVFVVSSGERSWIDLKHGATTWTTEKEVAYENLFGSFPNIGSDRVEWQLAPSGIPDAVTFRIKAQNIIKRTVQKSSRLFVVDLSRTPPALCGVVKTNEEARLLAVKRERCSTPLLPRELH